MKRENLVYLSGIINYAIHSATFKPDVPYRCIEISEGGRKEFMVFGIVFDEKTFNDTFVYVYDRMLRNFEAMGLTIIHKPISKTAFVRKADIHVYGTGSRKKCIWFFRNSKDVIYGFYPMQGTKKEQTDECYQWFLELVSGNMESFDAKDVQFGNCGIPIGYGDLRVW